MITDKDTAIEVRQIDGHIQLFLLTGLINGMINIGDENGIPIVNPIEGLRLLKNTTDRFHWVDRIDFEIKRSPTEHYLIAEVITGSTSKFTHSRIGSTHWFNTIISEHSRIGEYMFTNSFPTDSFLIESWGKRLHESSMELINWSQKSKVLTNE